LQHVLAAVLHVMKRVNETLTPHHPKPCISFGGFACAAAFMRKLSDTIFQMVAEDVEAVKRFHTGNNRHAMGKAALDKKGPQCWTCVTRRFIREPEALKAALDKLWQDFAGTEGLDPATGQPRFTEVTPLVLVAIKELIDHGHFCGESPLCLCRAR